MKYRILYLLINIIPGVVMPAMDIRYTLRFEDPQTHIVEISADITGLSGEYHDFYMPVWTPGSYLVREFSRNVVTFSANKKTDLLKFEKQNKNTWRVFLAGNSSITIEYQVYAFEYTVRTNFIDSDLAFLNGAGLFIFPVGFEERKIRVDFEPYISWEKITTELPKYKGDNFSYIANNLDQLIDSPILLGNQRTITFDVLDIPHTFAITDTGNYNLDQIMGDTRKVIESAYSIFGEIPYDHYTFFLNLIDGSYGGLEHKNSCSLIYDPWKFEERKDYIKFMGLVSHEFFHVFNVKRIRPKSLGPFDYQHENYTDLLWVSEGMTAYYDNLLLRRTGIADTEEYLNLLSEDIKKLEATPGRKIQSVAESSFDAWIKLYRQNENSVNSMISYYLKGSLIGLILDLEIRHFTHGKFSLDDVFRQLWENYSQTGDGFSESDFLNAAEKAAGKKLPAARKIIHGVDDIDFGKYLGYAGLRIVRDFSDDKDKNHAWFGMKFNNGNLVISRVIAGSPAYRNGLNVSDELIAINGIRLTSDNVQEHLTSASKDCPSSLLISRRGKIRTIEVTAVDLPANKYKIVKIENSDTDMKKIYSTWLDDNWEPGVQSNEKEK